MKTKQHKPKVRDLNNLGYKRTTIKGLYIKNDGTAYNFTTHRNLKARKSFLHFMGKDYNIAKLVLQTFCKIPIRNGHIKFKNGIKTDFNYLNLEYKCTVKQNPPNEKDLVLCVRLYFKVREKFNKNSFMFKYYLDEISKKRGFEITTAKTKGSILFFEWLRFGFNSESKSIYNLGTKHGFSATNGKNEVYKYLNLLVNEVIEDYKKGFLKVNEFYKPVRKKTLKQALKEFNNLLDRINIQVDEQKKYLENVKQTLNKLPKKTNHSHFFIENGILYESYNTIRGLRYLKVMDVLGMPNEKKCDEFCLYYIIKEYLN